MSDRLPNQYLQTLMSLVDDLQDHMPEGKYLEAMNALRDLHAGKTPPPPPPAPFSCPVGRIRLTADELQRYREMERRRSQGALSLRPEVLTAYRQIRSLQTACTEAGLTETQWVEMTEDRDPIIKRALEIMSDLQIKQYLREKNPRAMHCPFMARNSDGHWHKPSKEPRLQSNGNVSWRPTWDCLCGSKNIQCKNWRQHEVSDKHITWENGGRHITKNKVKTMKEKRTRCISHAEGLLGQSITWKQEYPGYQPQSRNEWTDPELFAGKPKDWVPPELPLPAPVYTRGNTTYGPAVMIPAYVPLPQEWVHHDRTAGPYPVTLSEEQYAIFISMEQ